MLTPLYPSSDPHFPGPTSVSLNRASIHVDATSQKLRTQRSLRKKHWNIVRSAPARRKETAADEDQPAWQTPREHHSTDYGALSVLQERLAQEFGLQNVGQDLGSEIQLFPAIRRTIDRGITWNDPSLASDDLDLTESGFWTRRARQAEDYVKDMIYGGIDGLAYVRSLAEFVSHPRSEVCDISRTAYLCSLPYSPRTACILLSGCRLRDTSKRRSSTPSLMDDTASFEKPAIDYEILHGLSTRLHLLISTSR